jgi:hypothetical protein
MGQWPLFQPILGYGSGSKEKQLSWVNYVNLKRNIVSHASSGKTLSVDELHQLDEYERWLTQKIGEMASDVSEKAEIEVEEA